MSLGEFDLIQRFFTRPNPQSGVVVDIGDDAAIVTISPNQQLVTAVDTLVSGVHFFADVDPAALGHKALAVNLSDMAAMGAEPKWITLALTLPEVDETWLPAFADGLLTLAARHNVALIGGDTTRGPLTITVQIQGVVPQGQALLRSGAQVGDKICVTGTLGDAGLVLAQLQGRQPQDPDTLSLLRTRLERPEPRLAAGIQLRGLASSAIDISDGLAADLGHILKASGVGAEIHLADLPLSDEVVRHVEQSGRWDLPMGAGDDYELCFTLPAERFADLQGVDLGVSWSVIGEVVAGSGLRCFDAHNKAVSVGVGGYDHFGADV